jgi:hypothetical protein
MKKIKVSFLWCGDIQNQLFYKILEKFSNNRLVISDIKSCDILFIGTYDFDYYSIKRKFFNKFANKKRFDFLKKYFFNLDLYSLRNYKPIRVFVTTENFRNDGQLKYDYSITPELGITEKNHLRFQIWKESLDWSHEKINHENVSNAKRYGKLIKIENLKKPLGKNFLSRAREFIFFTSHLNEPRKSIYDVFNKNFKVHGYGPFFNKKIQNHNSSNFVKKDILKNFAFNLCPNNSLYPGYYTEGVVDSFDSGCLPVTWADQNIEHDFNTRSFVNLNNHVIDNFSEICEKLKDDLFLNKFTTEPLLLSDPDINLEIKFAKSILNNFF